MNGDQTRVTVAHLVVTLDRVDSWIQALRKALAALPQDMEIGMPVDELKEELDVRQPFLKAGC